MKRFHIDTFKTSVQGVYLWRVNCLACGCRAANTYHWTDAMAEAHKHYRRWHR